jgi:hypothetical protein
VRDQENRQVGKRYAIILCLGAALTGLLSLLAQPGSAAQANPTATPTVLSVTTTATVPAIAPTTRTTPVETTPTAAATATSTQTPQATETPVPTETPRPTETAAPTSTPSPTPTATITVVLAELVPTSTPNLTSEQEQIGTITVLIFLGIVVMIIAFAIRWMIRAAKREPGGE